MGNQKFRLSHMIPNAWFYKLKEMNNKQISNKPHQFLSYTSPTAKLKNHRRHLPAPPPPPSSPPTSTTNPPPSPPRKSYHFTRDLQPKTPHKSKKTEFNSNSDLILNLQHQLPPILTKPRTPKSPVLVRKRLSATSPGGGVRLRRVVRQQWQVQNGGCCGGVRVRRKIPESCMAVEKASRDPQKDFRESMVEMIVENHLTASKDLEDLLASYLSLNSHEYHHLIIMVFKQLWLDLRRYHLV